MTQTHTNEHGIFGHAPTCLHCDRYSKHATVTTHCMKCGIDSGWTWIWGKFWFHTTMHAHAHGYELETAKWTKMNEWQKKCVANNEKKGRQRSTENNAAFYDKNNKKVQHKYSQWTCDPCRTNASMLPPANAIHHIPIHWHTEPLDSINEIKTALPRSFTFERNGQRYNFNLSICPLEMVESGTQ